MLKLLDEKITIYTRDPIYKDWRDWFIIEDKQINIYETNLKIFFDKEFILEKRIPINISKFHADIQVETDKKIDIKEVIYIVPEMGLVKKNSADANLNIGDVINFSLELSFFD